MREEEKSPINFIAVLFALMCVTVNGNPRITSSGATFPSPVYTQWFYIYKAQKPEVAISYSAIGSGRGKDDIFAGRVDFAGSDSDLTENDYITYANKDLVMVPFVAGSVVMVYNIDCLDSQEDILVLTREVLFQIYTAQISSWNDPRIVDIQHNSSTAAKLANCTLAIRPIVRSDRSGTTAIFVQSLRSFNGSVWDRPVSDDSWLSDMVSSSGIYANFLSGNGNFEVLGEGFTVEGSIAYVSYALVKNQDITKFATIINKNGKVTSPDSKYIVSAMDTVNYTSRFTADITDSDDPTAYPMAGFSYLILERTQMPYHNCQNRRELFKFFRWVLEDTLPKEAAEYLGFSHLSSNLSQRVLNILHNFSCDGKGLLDDSEIDKTTISTTIMVLNSIAIVFGVIIAIAFLIYGVCIAPEAQAFLLYGGSLSFGAFLMKISLYFWAAVPDSSWTCMARLWFLCLGFSVVLAANFSRASMLKWIRQLVKSTKWGKKKPSFFLFLFRDILIFSSLQIVILAVWTRVDPYRSLFVVTDPLNLVGEWRCESSSSLFFAIELALVGVSALYGIFLVYQTWNMSTQANQVKWILISTYNNVIIFTVFGPLFYFQTDETSRSALAVVSILLLSLQSEICFFAPVYLYDALKKTSSSSGTMGSTGSKTLSSNAQNSKLTPAQVVAKSTSPRKTVNTNTVVDSGTTEES